MSKQRPDSDKLANELLGASAFFRAPAKPVDEPAKAEPETPSQVQEVPAPEKMPADDVTTSRRHSVTTSSPTSSPSVFDINRATTSRDSLRLSMDETRALDELRQTLKWDYDVTVSKNDICRAALHWLLEDFASKGEKSVAVARLRRKQTSR
jgi:hypothetical protein